VEILTSTRGYLPAIVTSVSNMSEKYDLELGVRFSENYQEQDRCVSPLRIRKTASLNTSIAASAAHPESATTVLKNPGVQVVLFVILVILKTLVFRFLEIKLLSPK